MNVKIISNSQKYLYSTKLRTKVFQNYFLKLFLKIITFFKYLYDKHFFKFPSWIKIR